VIHLFALTTDQGTAMPETALCSAHNDEPGRVLAVDAAASDWDGEPSWQDCTQNQELSCIVCGYTLIPEETP
jgi:hypothetical protein